MEKQRFQSIVQFMERHAAQRPDEVAYQFLRDGEVVEEQWTFQELNARAKAIASHLARSAKAGDRALLLYPPGLDYIAAFMACLCAGLIAVPAYPPRRNKPSPRLDAMVEDSCPRLILTIGSWVEDVRCGLQCGPEFEGERLVITDSPNLALDKNWMRSPISGDDLAFLQYTSGSTGSPKGVMVSHSNLLHNEAMVREAFGHSEHTVMVSWLPLYHDMGLIGGVLQPLFLGGRAVLMSPVAFAQRPLRWLQAIDRFGGTTSGAPNFAYALCAEKIKDEEAAGLDLSRWTLAFCGAEPVRAETIDRFHARFSAQGFRRRAFYPVFGMAEATLLISSSADPERPRIFEVDRQQLQSGRCEASNGAGLGSQRLVGCGKAWGGQEIVIVDPSSKQACPSGRIGEIWMRGESVAAGYWNRADATAEAFQARLVDSDQGPYFRTGDLGVIVDGELICTGRLKDLIIVRGRNHYPQDIEATAQLAHPCLRADGGAAFAIEIEGEERVVVVHEVAREFLKRLDATQVFADIRRSVWEQHELQLHGIVLLSPATLPKTSSGKVQRSACRERFLAHSLSTVAEWRATAPLPPDETDIASPPAPRASDRAAPEIEAWLVDAIARRLGVPSSGIDPNAPTVELGLDSVSAVGLIGELQSWLGAELPATIAYDYPSIRSLSTHLAAYSSKDGKISLARPKDPQGHDIAIIGMACRFPGAPTLEEFWTLLEKGIDAIREVPADRWHADEHFDFEAGVPGKMNTRWGGFIDKVDHFDPTFFGIAPKEAMFMDPQQRLLLEVAWEAFERAGVRPRTLAGSRTGVFVGITNSDYAHIQRSEASRLSAYFGTGNSFGVAANRISYLLDLQGPSWAVDTGCSSSLVAVHQACESLRRGESELALAGGANLILSPEVTIALSQAHMMSPTGRCRTFSANADGYVRSEGCGVVVLKRRADALKDGDRILAVIRGSAVNQDGRTNGLTAPNGLSQQRVIQQALADAGLESTALGYVETHGTGTILGDPIEVNALCEVLGRGRRQPCWLGSVKANIGHLESAAGIASLIKTVLVLKHGKAPPQLHLGRLNPHLAGREKIVDIPRELREWPATGAPRRAGVSAFSFGGTNAHLILEEALPTSNSNRPIVADRIHHLLTLSARDETALREYAARFATHLRSNPSLTVADVCYTANIGRESYEHRLAVIASNVESLAERLDGFAQRGKASDLFSGRTRSSAAPQDVAFLFTGQGSQHHGMGTTLYRTSPIFRDAIDACDRILRPIMKQSLAELLYSEKANPSELNRTEWAQPALFALQYALTRLWRSFGVSPTATMGHSIGEYPAAWAAGCFDWEKALLFVAERGRFMQALPSDGAMWSVRADARDLKRKLAPYAGNIVIAAFNSPHNTVVAGSAELLLKLVGDLRKAGFHATPLDVSHAFHSPLMEPALDALEAAAQRLRSRPPMIPLVSNLTGDFVLTPPDAGYWRRHSREGVRFMDGLRALHARGHKVFLEIGAQPVLTALGQQCVSGPDLAWLPSLSRGRDDWEVLLGSLAELYVRGLDIDWGALDRAYDRRKVELPTYPFQRQSYWLMADEPKVIAPSSGTPQNLLLQTSPIRAQSRAIVVDELKSLLSRLLGIPSSQISEHTRILSMGADSLVLMSAIQSIEAHFAVTITVRQIFEELGTLDALAQHIVKLGGKMPPAASQSPAPHTPQAAEVSQGAEGAGQAGSIHELLGRQLELIAQHIRLLETGYASASAATSPHAITPEHGASSDLNNVESPTWRPVRTERRALSGTQQWYLQNLISRFAAKTSRSKQAAEEGRPYRADMRGILGFRPETKEICFPIVGRCSAGSAFVDIDGNEYVDISMGFGVHLFGHGASFIRQRLEEQLAQGIQLGPQAELANEVADMLCGLTGNERAAFCTTGTEAVMTAVRLVRAFSQRSKIAIFSGAYHGHSDGLLSLSRGRGASSRPVALGMGVPQGVVDHTIVLDYGQPSALRTLEEHAHELAAVLVEPVQSRFPGLQPASFLQELRVITAKHGVPLVFDEVITGLRTHPRGAQGWFGVEADLSIYGKVLGGGLPIGAVAGQSRYFDSLDGGQWSFGDDSAPGLASTFVAGTFNKHPLSLAGASAVLGHLIDAGPQLQEDLNARTRSLAARLNERFTLADAPIKVSHFGSMFRFAWSDNSSYVHQPLEMDLFYANLNLKGVYVWEGRTCFLSTAHSDEDLDRVVKAASDALDELASAGFLKEGNRRERVQPLASQDAASEVTMQTANAAQRQLWAR